MKDKKAPKDSMISLAVTSDLKKQLAELAEAEGRSLSAMIVRIIERGLRVEHVPN